MSLLSTTSPLVYVPCFSLEEAQCLLDAQKHFRSEKGEHIAADSPDDVAARIVQALTAAPLPKGYSDYLGVLYKAADYLDIRAIAKELNISPTQIGAMASKLSARLKKVATAAELRDLKTPLNLLVSIRYDQTSKEASHQLTDPAGRTAARLFLGIA